MNQAQLVYIMAQVVKSDADSSNDCVTLSRAEYDELLALRSSTSKSSVAEVVCSAGDGLSAQGDRWIIDSGASGHLCGNSSNFLSLKPVTGQKGVRLADGSSSPIVGQGNMSITPTLQLSHVLHAPSFPHNLLSVSRMTKELNCRVIFYPMGCTFQDLLTGRRIGGGYEEGGLYYLHQPEVSAYSAVTSSSSPLLWHHRLGHLPVTKLRRVIPHIPPSVSFQCETCQLGKHCRSSFPSSQSPSSQGLFDLLHVDVWGPSRIPNRSQCRYYLVIVDDFSRLSWVFLLKDRSQGPVILKSLIAEIKTQFDVCVKIVRTDNALEFKSKDLLQFYSGNGIQPQFTCPHTSQQNGVAERKHRQILNVARCLMIQSNMPASYWGDAVLTAGFLINRMPSSSVEDQIPIQILHPEAPLFPIPPKVFGCVCFVHKLGPDRDKLAAQSIKCVFLGYPKNQKGYRCYDPISHKEYVSADVTFFESIPYFSSTTPRLQESLGDILPLPIPPFSFRVASSSVLGSIRLVCLASETLP